MKGLELTENVDSITAKLAWLGIDIAKENGQISG